jgi:hypothetical protein
VLLARSNDYFTALVKEFKRRLYLSRANGHSGDQSQNDIDDHCESGATVFCVLKLYMFLGFYLCARQSCSYCILLTSGRLHEGVGVVIVGMAIL